MTAMRPALKAWGNIGFVLLCAAVLAVSLRGIPGNPTSRVINSPKWKDDGPLELSPDRGRFALAYSVVEDKSLTFSIPVARFTTPDVAVRPDGRYVSLFPPGVSFLVIPGYLVGKFFGAAQVGMFAVIALFALLNALLLRAIAVRIGASSVAASLAALTFLFATPAFTYAVTLYQHHISVFLLLLSIYLLLTTTSLWGLAAIWFSVGTAVVVDYPNAVLMLPVALAASLQAVVSEKNRTQLKLGLRMPAAATLLAVVVPLGLLLWFNKASYGSAFQLSGTLPTAEAIDARGRPTRSELTEALRLSSKRGRGDEKTAIGFFKTRNLLNGFYIHFISPDRGIIYYAPVVLLGIGGLVLLYKRRPKVATLFIATVGFNVLLYSMWGDPWGGWAFGSRYLIPTYALLCVGLALVLMHWRRNVIFVTIFTILFGYSVWVNGAGALSSSRNPPQVEVLNLEKLSGQEEKYTFLRNFDYLDDNRSKSFFFQTVASPFLSARAYHRALAGLIFVASTTLLVIFLRKSETDTLNLMPPV